MSKKGLADRYQLVANHRVSPVGLRSIYEFYEIMLSVILENAGSVAMDRRGDRES